MLPVCISLITGGSSVVDPDPDPNPDPDPPDPNVFGPGSTSQRYGSGK